MTYFFSDITFA